MSWIQWLKSQSAAAARQPASEVAAEPLDLATLKADMQLLRENAASFRSAFGAQLDSFKNNLHYRQLGREGTCFHAKEPEGFREATGAVVIILDEIDCWLRYASLSNNVIRVNDAHGGKASFDWYDTQTPRVDMLAQLENHLGSMKPYFEKRRNAAKSDASCGDVDLLKQYTAMIELLPQLKAHPFITDSLGKLESITQRLRQKERLEEENRQQAEGGNGHKFFEKPLSTSR